MSEILNDKQVFSLLEVANSISSTIASRYQSSFWVKAEMNKLNFYKHSGHCYPELVEKKNGKVIAQMKSNLWRDEFVSINRKFLRILKEPLKDGIKILFQAQVSFDPCYGLALRILDIDPGYTLGDLEVEKQQTIDRLIAEGVFSKNKFLKLPLLPQRIAIISVESSKGYADFLSILNGNSWNYKFFHYLFPSLLQGEKAAEDIARQLKKIRRVAHHFDVVAIIRGGGGDIGLSCYNNYHLAREIADYPVPVITGIGHATNETVAEMISHTNAITPSKLAEFIIQQFHNFSVPVQKAEEKIAEQSRRVIKDEKLRFEAEIKLFRSVTANSIMQTRHNLRNLSATLSQCAQFFFKEQSTNLQVMANELRRSGNYLFRDRINKVTALEKQLAMLSPQNVLKRGYSITRLNGQSVRQFGELKIGDTIVTELYEGKIESSVMDLQKEVEDE